MSRITASRPTSVECAAGTTSSSPWSIRMRPRTVSCCAHCSRATSRSRSTTGTSANCRATVSASTAIATTVIRRAGSPRFDHPFAREHTRPLSSGNARLTPVYRRAKVMIAERHVLVFALHGSELNVTLVLCSQLVRAWPHVQAAFTTVETDTVHRDVVDHRPVIDVGDVSLTQVGNRPVVIERTTAPVTALEANTTVPITVVDTTVKTYVRAPIAGVPNIGALSPTPVTRSPQQTRGGCQDPGARDPVIVAVVPSPITWCPDVTDRGAGRLHVHRQRRRREVYGDADRHEREGRHRQGRQRKSRQSGPGRSEAKRFLTHDDLVAIVD